MMKLYQWKVDRLEKDRMQDLAGVLIKEQKELDE